MIETHLTTPFTTPTSEKVAHKPRKRELKNLTKREGIWYFHKSVNGKKEFNGRATPFSLETRDFLVAKARRDAIIKAANGSEIDRVRGKEHNQAATVGKVFEVYRAATTVRANADTRESNIAALVNMVRLVRGPEFDVEEMSTLELTRILVKDWQMKRIAAAQASAAGDLSLLESKKRAVNSTLKQIQSVFSREAKDDYSRLYLPPNIIEFTTALPVAARKQEEPEQLTDELVGGLLAKVEKLQAVDAGAWAAFQLMTWGGLRNCECFHARVTWLEQLGDVYRMRMKPTEDFIPKGNSRAVIMPGNVVEAMLAQLPYGPSQPEAKDERHLIPGRTMTERKEAAYRRLNAWLKAQGVGTDAFKVAYRLRKFFLNKVNEQQGIMFAQAAAGHSSRKTTEDHYTGKPKMAEPIRLAAC